jgi:hypothetical protein
VESRFAARRNHAESRKWSWCLMLTTSVISTLGMTKRQSEGTDWSRHSEAQIGPDIVRAQIGPDIVCDRPQSLTCHTALSRLPRPSSGTLAHKTLQM